MRTVPTGSAAAVGTADLALAIRRTAEGIRYVLTDPVAGAAVHRTRVLIDAIDGLSSNALSIGADRTLGAAIAVIAGRARHDAGEDAAARRRVTCGLKARVRRGLVGAVRVALAPSCGRRGVWRGAHIGAPATRVEGRERGDVILTSAGGVSGIGARRKAENPKNREDGARNSERRSGNIDVPDHERIAAPDWVLRTFRAPIYDPDHFNTLQICGSKPVLHTMKRHVQHPG